MWATVLPRLDGGDLAVALHMDPPHIDLDDPLIRTTRTWHWLRERVLAAAELPATPTT